MRTKPTPRPPWTWLLLLLLVLCPQGFSAAAELTALRPLGQVELVPVGKKQKIYLAVGSETVKIPVTGPGVITGYARVA